MTYEVEYKDRPSADIYEYWRGLYRLLATLPMDDAEFRHDPKTLETLRAAHWVVDDRVVDQYWTRVSWVAGHCSGRVLEVGCGMGNILRWIAERDDVSAVTGFDLLETYIAELTAFNLPKVEAHCADITRSEAILTRRGPFNTIVMSEVIEHLNTAQELAILRALRPHIAGGGSWVITTPIDFMPDPDHKRGFMRWYFRLRTRLLYGSVLDGGDNGGQQFLATASMRRRLSAAIADQIVTLLDWCFTTRPSGLPWSLVKAILRPPYHLIRRVACGRQPR